ncbi:hypothetical protein [Enterobacter ludwigii]|uniref:hypothetical protein n=1 Tax=Enterobacter ludwigii TaxID=299767 RepID=UPI00186635B9|nr:hypothetical protein [Enterobacter ludwigii]
MNYDLVKSVVLPVVASVFKPLAGYIMKLIFGPHINKRRRFNKISFEQKVSAIEKIDELNDKLPTSHTLFQLKLLYEQIGVNLPVWVSHKLIAFLVIENIRTQDDQLNGFLNNTSIAKYSTDGCILNKRVIWGAIIIYLLFAVCAIAALVYYGNIFVLYFLSNKKNTLSYILFLVIICIIYIVAVCVVSEIAKLFKGVIFVRRFDVWLRQNIQKEHAEISAAQIPTTSDPA